MPTEDLYDKYTDAPAISGTDIGDGFEYWKATIMDSSTNALSEENAMANVYGPQPEKVLPFDDLVQQIIPNSEDVWF